MLDWFAAGGVFMWPVLIAGLVALALALDAARRVPAAGEPESDGSRLRSRIDAVLFWGGFSALLGVLGTLVGIGMVADHMGRAGSASAGVVWQGIGVALHTTSLGLILLLVSLAAWFALRVALRRQIAA